MILTLALCCDMAFCQSGLHWLLQWRDFPCSVTQVCPNTRSVPAHVQLCSLGTRTGLLGTTIPWFGHKEDAEITIRIKYRADEWLDRAYVVLSSMDEKEDVTGTDTIALPLNDSWRELSFSRTISPTAYLVVTIEFNAKAGVVPKIDLNASVYTPIQKGVLSLAEVRLLEGGRELLCDLPSHKVNAIDANDMMPLNDMRRQPIMDTRILAVGSSVHGSETFRNTAMELMRERIERHNCKLVLFEASLYDMLYINRYVKNDERFDLSNIKNRLDLLAMPDSMRSFIDWVRKYNVTHDNSVSLLGFDVSFNYMNDLNLFDFLYQLNDGRHEILDTLCVRVRKPGCECAEMCGALDSVRLIPGVITDEEAALVRHCIYNLSASNDTVSRDVRLAKTAEVILGLFADSAAATIYAHNNFVLCSNTCHRTVGHMITTGWTPMGKYLKNRYHDDYKCLSLICFEGMVKLRAKGKANLRKLEYAPVGSLEYQISLHAETPVYLPTCRLSGKGAYKTRNVGMGYTSEQFAYHFPDAIADGIVWMKGIEETDKPLNMPTENVSNYKVIKLIESYKKLPPFKGWKPREEK